MTQMIVKAALIGCAFALLASAASAQDAAPEGEAQSRAPLIINDDSIGILKSRQVGSIILPQGKPPFRAVVAFYPFCPPAAVPLASELKIFIGDADDWTAASRCTALVEKYGADAPRKPSLVVYPGAKHGFDAKLPERLYFGHQL